jgi:hypothetical protein
MEASDSKIVRTGRRVRVNKQTTNKMVKMILPLLYYTVTVYFIGSATVPVHLCTNKTMTYYSHSSPYLIPE